MNTPQLTIEKHTSPDNPKGPITYYFILLEGQHQPIYGSKELKDVEKRYKHIQEIGYKAYIDEIQIIKEVLTTEDVNYPELIEALKKQEEERVPDAVINEKGENE